MSKTLVVNSIPFEYPEQGEQQPWGESATAWASEVTDLLNFVVGTFDKLESAVEIKETQPTNLLISNLIFPSSSVRSFVLTGSISRKYTSSNLLAVTPAPFSVAEQFTLTGIYNDSTSTWTIQQEAIGDCFVSFDIDSSGQLYYQSQNLTTIYTSGYPAWASGTNYVSGDMVLSSGLLYRCLSNHTSSGGDQPPNVTFWTPITFAGYSGLLKYKASTLLKT
jgi:hypothetical protein